jgi:hypothetical protein
MPDTNFSLYDALYDALHEPIVLAHIAALIAAMLATYVACYPVVAFVRRGWAIKRGEVVSSLSENAKKLYLEVCLNSSPRTRKPSSTRSTTRATAAIASSSLPRCSRWSCFP